MTGKNCLVGHCVNLLPIRTRLEPDASFQENLTAVKKSVLDAYDHHQCTIGRILQTPHAAPQLQPAAARRGDFQRGSGSGDGGVSWTSSSPCERNPKRALHYDLFFNFVEGPPQACTSSATTTRICLMRQPSNGGSGTTRRCLKALRRIRQRAWPDLPSLTEAERTELTVEWNRTGLPTVRRGNGPSTRLFERQVAKTPDAQARDLLRTT